VQLRGVFDAARDVLSIEFPDQGGRYDFVRDRDATSGFYPRPGASGPYHYRVPAALGDGWDSGSLEAAAVSRTGIEKFVQMLIDMPVDSVHTPEVEALLVARRGRLILEEYFHGFDRDALHDTRSAGKSITAVVAGAALQAGAPLALWTPVYQLMNGGQFPPGLGAWKRAMTLADLLAMRSGYYCNDSDPAAPGNEDTMIDAMLDGGGDPDFYHYVLKVPMAYAPDTVSVYCSTNPNLALGMVGHALRESPLDTFDRLLGGPLRIERYAWPLDGVGHPYGGGGVRIRPRDFLKLGQLMLNGGVWEGRRILAADFVAQATAPLHDLNAIQYGLLWWSIEYPYKKRRVRAYFAGGNGGQGIMVVPELDLVIGIFAGNYGDRVGLHVQEDLTPDFILPAVREAGDDPEAAVVEQDFHTPYAHPPVVAPTTLQK
jgi:CubicO group peptidase (beta-lactamase class C family)